MDRRSVSVAQPEIAADGLGFFRWGRVGGRVLATTDAADWTFLTEAEFADLLAGRIAAGHARFDELQRKGFLRDGLDLDALAQRMAQRNRHVRRGPHLHVVTLSTRAATAANGRTSESAGGEMSRETAEQIVNLALQSNSAALTFELQAAGGDPLSNAAVLRDFIEFARTRNKQTAGKTLTFRVLTNLSAMTEELAEWLIANDVAVSTSLDGPARLHDANRAWKGGSAHADVVRWIDYFTRRYAELKRDPQAWRVDAAATVTRDSLGAAKEIVDEYVARGVRTIRLRRLERSDVDAATWATVGYAADDYFAFYRRALDYIVELNRRGVPIAERLASIIVTKILTSDDPEVVDIQSPTGAGTGELAYGVDGRIFPDDDARRVDESGDAIFELGHARDASLTDLLRHETVRAIAAASLLDSHPQCADCWNKPFCGISPVHNFITQGDLFGQRPHCLQCKEQIAVSTRLFELLADDADAEAAEILKRWTAPALRPGSDRSLKPAP